MEYGFSSDDQRLFPSLVQLTVTNACDMQCTQCMHPSFSREPGYRRSFMELKLYKKIVKEVGMHKDSSLRIFGWGEPLLHPDIIEMVAFAKEQGVGTVNLITNGLKLDKKMGEGLLRAGLDLLEVSIDALRPETYSRIRSSPANFAKVVSNVKSFVAMRDQFSEDSNEGLGGTYVTVSIINQPKVKDEYDEFIRHWSSIVDEVVIRKFHDFMGAADDKEKISLPPRHPCRCLWSRFNINSDGLVSVCFNDWHNKTILGDMNEAEASISTIWQDKAFDDLRKSHLSGKPKGICESCNDWIGASWDYPYEKLFEKVKERKRRLENIRAITPARY